jgi:starch synthase
MKGGIVYSNYINTVSPHHAWEARFTDVGYGLGHTLEIHQGRFSGILNGVDYNLWNPKNDTYLPFQYDIDHLENKAKNKKALRERLLLEDSNKPIIAYIGRLDDQKGVHLVHHAIYYAVHRNAQFVLLGSATSADVNSRFWHEKQFLNDNPNVHLELGFNEELARLIYAGADMLVVPSNFEPCGLTQLISLKYGTVPIVRGVGGLLSTVFDRDYDLDHAPEKRNGYVFYQMDNHALESAMERAIGLYYEYPKEFEQLVQQGMECDYSWHNAGKQYLSIYEHIRFQ